METTTIVVLTSREQITDVLTNLLRTGAQQLIATAVEAEFESNLTQFASARTQASHAAVVRNGHHPILPFPNGYWSCERSHLQGAFKDRSARDVPFSPSAAYVRRTSNPIESAFATIRHRTKRSKGCLSGESMLHMIFKLGQCAEQNWRKLRGFDTLAKVIAGVKFKDRIEATKPSQIAT